MVLQKVFESQIEWRHRVLNLGPHALIKIATGVLSVWLLVFLATMIWVQSDFHNQFCSLRPKVL